MLILDENGKVIESNNKSVDELKRESYKHGNEQILKEEEKEELTSFVDSLEELEGDGEEDANMEADNLDPSAAEVAMVFAEFKANFVRQFGEEECQDAFLQFEDFFSGKGVDVSIDLGDLGAGEGIPGVESSEQEIISSEIEEQINHTKQQFNSWLERKGKK
jgi:hypothetical protein